MTQVRMSEILSPAFHEFWAVSRSRHYLRYVLKGGRGSGKSFTVPFRIISDLMEFPISGLGVRKVQHTIKRSMMENLKEAAYIMGVDHLFHFAPAALEITYKPRGNKMYFAGADDPQKIKSIKDAEFPVAFLWFEEAAEFKEEKDITDIELSVLRAKLTPKQQESELRPGVLFGYSIYMTYNPPKRRGHWLNKRFETQDPPPNEYIHHSTYLDNPHLTDEFNEEAEFVKANNERKYRLEYMGEPIGSGVVPFDNLQIRRGSITDEMVASFDEIRQGVDFGYGPDEFAHVRWHYDKKRQIIYAIDEFYDVKVSLRRYAKWLKEREYQYQMTTADSAEPRSIDELKKEHDIKRIKGAKKGPDSVEYGEEWLGDLTAIVIDPNRTPGIAWEFENIDYQTDKDGDALPRLEDKNNHTIDATRYAFENDMRRSGVGFLT